MEGARGRVGGDEANEVNTQQDTIEPYRPLEGFCLLP